jgi:CheY-like chemotaxis protein
MSKILIVEDDALIRMSAEDLIEGAGFISVPARNADEAIAILEVQRDIRLVFTDIDMPGSMDGLKLSHYIRDRWPPIHLILASGKAMLEQDHLPAGALFFPKPYYEQTIVDAITSFLASGDPQAAPAAH